MPSNSEVHICFMLSSKNKKEEKDNACSSVHSILPATKKKEASLCYTNWGQHFSTILECQKHIFFKRNLMMKSGESQLIIYYKSILKSFNMS